MRASRELAERFAEDFGVVQGSLFRRVKGSVHRAAEPAARVGFSMTGVAFWKLNILRALLVRRSGLGLHR